jgi:hypothetical protein
LGDFLLWAGFFIFRKSPFFALLVSTERVTYQFLPQAGWAKFFAKFTTKNLVTLLTSVPAMTVAAADEMQNRSRSGADSMKSHFVLVPQNNCKPAYTCKGKKQFGRILVLGRTNVVTKQICRRGQ